MAISRIGALASTTSIANSGSASVSVPSDAQIMFVAVVGYEAAASTYFSTGAVTIGGNAMTAVAGDAEDMSQGAIFYRVSPPTGTQTLAWDWLDTGDPDFGVIIAYGFYKGINTGGAIRDTFGDQATGSSQTTDSMTAQSGDWVIAWSYGYRGSGTPNISWTNATEVSQFGPTNSMNGAWAEATPSGNVTVSTTASPAIDDGGIVAIVLIPDAVAGRTTRNTRSWNLGEEVGMGHQIPV